VLQFSDLSPSKRILLSFCIVFGASLILTLILTRLAPWLGLVDEPGHRKVHTRTTPKGGGLAIYASVLLGAYLNAALLNQGFRVVLAVGFFVMLLGLIDDFRSLPWYVRLEVQFVAAFAVVHYGLSIHSWYFYLAAVVWIVGLTNAFNMLDNMDGLSGGVALVAASLMAVAQIFRDDSGWDFYAGFPFAMMAAALAGFLMFNKPPARIFMGDAGSTFIGFSLGTLILSRDFVFHSKPQTWLVPFCIMAVPCYDLVLVTILRLRQGRSPFHADKQHLSHRLVELGLSSRAAVVAIVLLGLVSGISGLMLYLVTRKWALLIAVQIATLWVSVALIEYLRRLRSATPS
jgi:UDP-GlcNAc:undecaprenyl-phosphate/decaprenyl-phosphate GlcNAc-1-phosphate transferase